MAFQNSIKFMSKELERIKNQDESDECDMVDVKLYHDVYESINSNNK
jgi:hypothetical protein